MNRHRGEVAVSLGKRDYVLRPSFEALVDIEQRTGTPLVTLARRFMERAFGLQDVLAVLAACIKASGQPVPKDLGEQVVRAGIATLAAPVAELLGLALTGDSEGNGEAAPEETS